MERVLAIIRKDATEDKVSIDTPTQNLERYFLDVVQNARQAAAETSGAMSGARVAAYLRGEAEAKPAPDRILDRLTAPQAAVPAPAPATPSALTVRAEKLAALTKPVEPAAPAPATTPAPTRPMSAEALRKADEKLAGLVKKQDGG
jgi:hypothetical protein